MGSAAAEAHTISPHRPMIVATGSPERAELVAGMAAVFMGRVGRQAYGH